MIFFGAKKKYYRVLAGRGVLNRRIGDNNFVSPVSNLNFVKTSWDVQIVEDRVYVASGYVNDMEPQLNGEPVGGVYADGSYVANRPYLSLPKSEEVVPVLLKITPNEKGYIFGEEGDDRKRALLAGSEYLSVYIGSMSEAAKHNPKSWIQPLALINKRGKVAQLSFFDYEYYASMRVLNEDLGLNHCLSAYPGITRRMLENLHERNLEK
jgi:hypothetical protein